VIGKHLDHDTRAEPSLDADLAALTQSIAAMQHEVARLEARIERLRAQVRPGWSPLHWFAAARMERKRELQEALEARELYLGNIRVLAERLDAMRALARR